MIRPATAEEMRFVRGSWARSWNVRGDDLTGGMLPWGAGRRVTAAFARKMHGAIVDEIATPETVLVWAVDGDEPLSWACRELVDTGGVSLCLVHFAYTVAPARSRGLASELLTYVAREADTLGVRTVHTHLNGPGRGLLRKLKNDDEQRADLL